MGEIGWFELSTARRHVNRKFRTLFKQGFGSFCTHKIENRTCLLFDDPWYIARGKTVAPIRELEYIELIVHSLSEPKVLNWVACGLWGMLMDLSGVAEQQESAELMSALVFDGGGWL